VRPADRPVLVTGCSSGIGLAAARCLRDRGYPVFASARRDSDVDRLRAEGLNAVRLDLDDDASIAAALDAVLERTGGRLYGLFNNGAYGQPGAVEDLRRDVLRAQLETALLGWHELTRRAIPVMRAQGEGRIILNSSVLGLVAFAYRGAYVAAKFALEGLTDTLRLELHGTGIQVSLIEPGPILSRFRDNAHRKFVENVDAAASPHRDRYRAMQARLTKEGAAQPFTLPPEAVVRRVIHALEARRAKARYYVTFPTYLFAALRRVLPTSVLDAALRAASGGGRR
jgi:NAD(P)-dependent dehydrogenase (short-subunit alcohol dehydrogenase family)